MTEKTDIKNVESSENRKLGDEWENWDGTDEKHSNGGKWLFILTGTISLLFVNVAIFFFVYLITPRLMGWQAHLPYAAWAIAICVLVASMVWLVQFYATIFSLKNFMIVGKRMPWVFEVIFAGAFKLASLVGISRDRMGHSFVQAYNSLSRATKVQGRKEKLLILLPRCLVKEQIKEINNLKNIYPIEIHTVSGGELARKRIREIQPSAVIGVACERDLVSGIRDVGNRISLIGIPNERPEGPCKNTLIDMDELIEAIEFYVGPPNKTS